MNEKNSNKDFDKHEYGSCSKCGYKGMMGVVSVSNKISPIMAVYFLIGFLMTFYCYINGLYVWIILGWVPLILKIMTRPCVLRCPKCGTEVKEKGRSSKFLVGKFKD
jgi:predicted RNA-binding Zn-ribbon protein involved in translation (DUF1610 family)